MATSPPLSVNRFLDNVRTELLLKIATLFHATEGDSTIDNPRSSAVAPATTINGNGQSKESPSPDSSLHPMLHAASLAGLHSTPLATMFSSEERLQLQRSTSTRNTTPSDNGDASPGTGRLLVQPGLTLSQTTRSLTLKRKLFDNDKEAIRAATLSISQEERVDLDDLENFAQVFKKQRIKFGFTQGDVGLALGKRYGTDFSQTTISRFEALNLSFKNMCKLRPLLKEWLCEAERAMAAGASPSDLLHRSPSSVSVQIMSAGDTGSVAGGDGALMSLKKRRKRTNLDCHQRTQLEEEFQQDPRPNHDKMVEISNRLELDRDVIRVWFCNRRQKVRKLEDERLTLASATIASAVAAQFGQCGPPLHLLSRSEGEKSPDKRDSPSGQSSFLTS